MKKELKVIVDLKIHERSIERKYRNYKWIMYLFIFGLSLMFFSLTLVYFLQHISSISNQKRIIITPVFYWNTILLIMSSGIIQLAKKYYTTDNYAQYKTMLILLISSGCLFLFGQIAGWLGLYHKGYFFNQQSASYLYVISGLHAIHILIGLIFLFVFLSKSWKMLHNYAVSVVYFTDPVIKSQLFLFSNYWHFLTAMWVYLLFFFCVFG